MKAVITGGLGSMGVYLAQHLVAEGWEVAIYDNLAKKASWANFEVLAGHGHRIRFWLEDCMDVRDYGEDTDVIFHLAGDCSARRSLTDPVHSFRMNAMLTCVVLEAARKHLTPVVYASSVRAYANKNGQRTIYGVGKWVGDILCSEYARTFGVPTASNRLGAVYGVYQHGTAASGWLNWFVKAMVQQLPLQLEGTGEQKRDCLHAADAADLFLRQAQLLIKTKACVGSAYPVGGGEANYVSLRDVLEYLRYKHGCSYDNITRVPARVADTAGRFATNAEVKEDHGWEPTISVWDGIDELVEHYVSG